MKYSLTRSSVVHPFLFCVMPILLLISLNLDEIRFDYVILPFLVTILITIGLWYLLNLLLKNKMKSGLILSVSLVLFFIYGHIFNIFSGVAIGDFEIGRHRYLLLIFIVLFVVGVYSILRTKKNLAEFTTIANVIVAVIILVSISNISVSLAENSFTEISADGVTFHTLSSTSTLGYAPNVYYIILDEYTSSKILKDIYDFDNHDFLSKLKARGFYIAENSFSNYPQTFLSVSSSLNMEYLNYLTGVVGVDSSDTTFARQLWDDNKVTQIFKSMNYTTVNSPIFASTAKLNDYKLCQDYLFNNPFQILLWESTILHPPFVEFHLDSSRSDRVLCKFSELSVLHNTVDEPFFVYAHFLSPHPPYLFGPNGELKRPKSLSAGASEWDDKLGYVEQVQFINKKLLETIDSILLESGSPPVIILQGDHGTPTLFSETSLNWHKNPSDAAIHERLSILNAYYLPSQNTELLYDSITPVNSFRLILNEYFNGDFELLDDKNYFSSYGYPYNFTDVTDILATHSPSG